MNRYMIPLQPVAPHARVFLRTTPRTPRDRAYVAAKLATGFRPGDADDPRMTAAVDAIRRAAIAGAADLAATMDSRLMGACVDAAVALQRRIIDAPAEDRACLGVAVVRALLDAAPDRCVALDRAVRDAARLHAHHVTKAHEATAATIIAEVLR